MKKILAIAFAAMMSLGTMAQTAQQVLDKTAAVIGNKKGATANFKLSSPKYGSASGTITIKGNKFNARTPEAIVWYNGKTQWTYMKKTNEVNVSNPTQAKQMSMNPIPSSTSTRQDIRAASRLWTATIRCISLPTTRSAPWQRCISPSTRTPTCHRR